MDQAFCAACGISVEVVHMTIGSGVSAAEAVRCPYCGFIFQSTEAGQPTGRILYPRVAVADDVEPVRKAVSRALLGAQLARAVDEFADGSRFVAAARTLLAGGAGYDLAILDLHMPIFDGLKAAVALRQLERQLGRPATPILFFSAVVCDERLKQHLTALGPGFYLNKGSVQGEQDLAPRLRDVLLYLRSMQG